jgi:hypothetical protein
VTLQSELGRGSSFQIRLPLHLSEETRLEFDLAGAAFAPPANLRIQGSGIPAVAGGASTMVNGGGSIPGVSPSSPDSPTDSGLGI